MTPTCSSGNNKFRSKGMMDKCGKGDQSAGNKVSSTKSDKESTYKMIDFEFKIDKIRSSTRNRILRQLEGTPFIRGREWKKNYQIEIQGGGDKDLRKRLVIRKRKKSKENSKGNYYKSLAIGDIMHICEYDTKNSNHMCEIYTKDGDVWQIQSKSEQKMTHFYTKLRYEYTFEKNRCEEGAIGGDMEWYDMAFIGEIDEDESRSRRDSLDYPLGRGKRLFLFKDKGEEWNLELRNFNESYDVDRQKFENDDLGPWAFPQQGYENLILCTLNSNQNDNQLMTSHQIYLRVTDSYKIHNVIKPYIEQDRSNMSRHYREVTRQQRMMRNPELSQIRCRSKTLPDPLRDSVIKNKNKSLKGNKSLDDKLVKTNSLSNSKCPDSGTGSSSPNNDKSKSQYG